MRWEVPLWCLYVFENEAIQQLTSSDLFHIDFFAGAAFLTLAAVVCELQVWALLFLVVRVIAVFAALPAPRWYAIQKAPHVILYCGFQIAVWLLSFGLIILWSHGIRISQSMWWWRERSCSGTAKWEAEGSRRHFDYYYLIVGVLQVSVCLSFWLCIIHNILSLSLS